MIHPLDGLQTESGRYDVRGRISTRISAARTENDGTLISCKKYRSSGMEKYSRCSSMPLTASS
jgi:hypothetical protein